MFLLNYGDYINPAFETGLVIFFAVLAVGTVIWIRRNDIIGLFHSIRKRRSERKEKKQQKKAEKAWKRIEKQRMKEGFEDEIFFEGRTGEQARHAGRINDLGILIEEDPEEPEDEAAGEAILEEELGAVKNRQSMKGLR